MAAFEIRPWLTCVDAGRDPTVPAPDAGGTDLLDEHDADERALLIRAQHPALRAAVDNDVDEIIVDGEPMSPRLHLLMHEVVVNQLVEDDPPTVRRTVRRLELEGHDRHEILHMIAGGVTGELWSALHDGTPTDIGRYVAYLDGLPGSWYEGFDGPADREPAAEAVRDAPYAVPDDVEPNDLFEVFGPPTGDGPAAVLARAMLDDGVDLRDRAAVDTWIDAFNALPVAERDHLLAGSLPEGPSVPIALPDDATLAAAALATPAVTQLARFVTWLDDHKPLTQQGNLKLADGAHLVGVLGTDDLVDETHGGRPVGMQSTTQLFGVDLVHRLAIASGLAERHRGSLRRTPQGTRLAGAFAASGTPRVEAPGVGPRAVPGGADANAEAEAVLDTWRTVVLATIRIGLVSGGRPDRYGLRWWEDTLNDGVVELLASALLADGPLEVDQLVDDALAQLADDYDLQRLSPWTRDGLPDRIAWAMGELADRLVWLGVATRDDVRFEVTPLDRERHLGGRIELTPLGSWFVRPALLAQGIDVPVIGALIDVGAAALLDAVADWPAEAFEAEVAAWATDRSDAADELAIVARHALDPDQIGVVFEALDVVGARAEPAVRALGDDPHYRPFASGWLRNHGLEPLPADERVDPATDLVRSLSTMIVTSGPDAAAEAAAAGHVDAALVEALWRVDDPWTASVLEVLGDLPDKRLAKAARRALFKRRNRN